MNRPTAQGLRDLFFLAAGAAVLYNQVWQRDEISPLGAFLVLFLWGLIPAFRADEGATSGPLTVLLHILAALGTRAPQAPPASSEAPEAPAAREAPEAPAADRADRADRADPEGQADPVTRRAPGAESPTSSPRESNGPESSL